MTRVIVLDSGPLIMVTSTRTTPANEQCTQWLRALLVQGEEIVIPEICDYEVRRGYLFKGSFAELSRLDSLKRTFNYRPLTTDIILEAALLWAEARKQGLKTSDDKALDGDMLLVAQSRFLRDLGDDVVIATTNVKHLTNFANAQQWSSI